MPFTIRQAGPADIAVIVEFNRLLAEESEGKTLDFDILEPGVEAVLADARKGLYFLAEEDGQAIGQLGLTFEWSDWRNGWFWWIQSVYVRKESRRAGVFKSLYRHVEEMARRDPTVIGLRLYVEEANTGAQQTYFKMGMTRTGYFVLEKYPLHVDSEIKAPMSAKHAPAALMDKPKEPTLAELIADHAGTAAAIRKAGQEAVLEHARAGLPVATWRDGKVVWLQPEEVFKLLGKKPPEG